MNPTDPIAFHRVLPNWARMLLLAMTLIPGAERASAATYRVGDVVTNFSFVARRQFTQPDGTVVPAGGTVQLSDFAGHIVFLEWFAVWCPYCVAAAPQVKAGIVDWYASRQGNPYGAPLIHIAVNQEPRSSYQAQTDSFVTQHNFAIAVNDYNSTGTNRARALFQTSGQPIFVVINGVTNSTTHQPWQLLVNHLGYGDTDFNQELAGFRSLINTVQPPVLPPILSATRRIGPDLEFKVQTQPGRNYRVEVSSDLAGWSTLRTIAGSNAPIVLRDTNTPPTHRFYRAVTP